MLTKRQAASLRGKIIHLLELADEYAHAGSHPPHHAEYIRGDYQRVKREVLDAILDFTEEKK